MKRGWMWKKGGERYIERAEREREGWYDSREIECYIILHLKSSRHRIAVKQSLEGNW